MKHIEEPDLEQPCVQLNVLVLSVLTCLDCLSGYRASQECIHGSK